MICMMKYLGESALMSAMHFEMHQKIRWMDGLISRGMDRRVDDEASKVFMVDSR